MSDSTQTWVDDGIQDRRDLMVQVITWGLVVIASTALFVPGTNPALFALLGLGPWALLLMVFLGNGRYLLFGPDWHTVIIGAMILPMILGMGALLHFQMIDWRPPLVWAVGMGMGYTLLGLMADASARCAALCLAAQSAKAVDGVADHRCSARLGHAD